MTEGAPLYYTKGRQVFKRAIRKIVDKGITSHQSGFLVCTISEFLDDDAAQFIADALDKHDDGFRGDSNA